MTDRPKRRQAARLTICSVALHNPIKLYASTGVSTRTGSDYDLGGIAWQYRWGGGL